MSKRSRRGAFLAATLLVGSILMAAEPEPMMTGTASAPPPASSAEPPAATAAALPAEAVLPPPRSDLLPPSFANGEKLRYGLAWLAIGGGEMSITTAAPKPIRGKNAYVITLEAASNDFFSKFFLVRDTIISTVEASRFESMRYEKHTQEGSHVNDEVQVFDLDKRETFYKGRKVPLPSHVLDTLSSVWYLRQMPLKAGQLIDLDAHANGKNYKLRVEVLGLEEVSVPAGTFKAWKLEPKLEGGFFKKKEGRLLIWLSDDEKRTPIRIRTYLAVGYVTASLLAPDQAAPSGENAVPNDVEKPVPPGN